MATRLMAKRLIDFCILCNNPSGEACPLHTTQDKTMTNTKNPALDADIIDLRACLEAAEFDKDSYAMELLRKIENRYTRPQPSGDAVKALDAFNKIICGADEKNPDEIIIYGFLYQDEIKTIRASLLQPKDFQTVINLVNKQAEDEGLWFEAKTAPEAYLQMALRKLHEVIEDAGK